MSPPTETIPTSHPRGPVRRLAHELVVRYVPMPIRRLTGRHWSWIHFKIAALVWMSVLLTYTPGPVNLALGAVIFAIAGATIAGALVSIFGIVLSAQPGKTGSFGIGIEFSGLTLMFLGPLSYLAIQVYLASTLPDGDQRYALIFLCYLTCAAFLCRFVIVAPRWWETRPKKPLTKLTER